VPQNRPETFTTSDAVTSSGVLSIGRLCVDDHSFKRTVIHPQPPNAEHTACTRHRTVMSQTMMTSTPSESLQHLRLAVELAGVEAPEIILPESRHVVVGGTRLHLLDWGTAGQPPLLFLHGGALSARTWDVVCLGLRGEYHCVALDQRGHGDSEWSPIMDYAPESHARDIDGVLDALGFERAVLIGQSMGGLNAFVYTRMHPERVAGLVLIDVGPDIRMAGAQRIGDFVHNTAEIDSIEDFVEQAMAFNPLRDRRLLTWSVRNNVRQLPSGKFVRKNDTRFFGRLGLEEVKRRIEASWRDPSDITCPVLVVRGELSDVFLDDAAERFAASLPHGRWARVAGAGHTVQGDNPAGLIAVMRPLLARVVAGMAGAPPS
jgi:pimeloyl-ACP methyl ester carboxylesterase